MLCVNSSSKRYLAVVQQDFVELNLRNNLAVLGYPPVDFLNSSESSLRINFEFEPVFRVAALVSMEFLAHNNNPIHIILAIFVSVKGLRLNINRYVSIVGWHTVHFIFLHHLMGVVLVENLKDNITDFGFLEDRLSHDHSIHQLMELRGPISAKSADTISSPRSTVSFRPVGWLMNGKMLVIS